MIRTVIVITLSVLGILLVMPWLILWSLLTGSQDVMYSWSMNAVSLIIGLVGIHVRVEGLENIPSKTCIFVANHVSNMDPLAFAPNIPRRVSLMLKKELFRMPILSYGMRLAKFICVDRASREGAANSAKLAVQYLKEGLSLAAYPEGTRSPDGRLLPFKKGTFVVAIQAGVPIVPVSIVGARKLMPKGESAIHPGEVLIRFGQPVDASQYTVATRGELLARVHSLVAAGLPDDQKPVARPSNTSESKSA